MGLKFIDTILSLVTAVAAVMVAYFAGHALAVGEAVWWIAAGVALLCAVAIGAFTALRIRRYAGGHDTAHG